MLEFLPKNEPFVVLIYGLPGAGKSYTAAAIAYDWLKAGFPVFANMRLVPDSKCKGPYQFNDDMSAEWFETLVAWREQTDKHTLAVLDEAQLLFNARAFKTFPKSALSVLSQHRRLGLSLVVVTQHPELVDTNFRRLAAYGVQCYNLSRFPMFGSLIRLCTRNLHFRAITVFTGGAAGEKVISRGAYLLDKRIMAFYSTREIVGREGEVSQRSSPAMRWIVRLVWWGAVAIAALWGFRWLTERSRGWMRRPRWAPPVVVGYRDPVTTVTLMWVAEPWAYGVGPDGLEYRIVLDSLSAGERERLLGGEPVSVGRPAGSLARGVVHVD